MFGVEETNINRKMKGMLMNESSYVNPCFGGINPPNMNMGFVNSCDFGYVAKGSSSSSSSSPSPSPSPSPLTFMHPFNSTMHQGTQIPSFRGIDSGVGKIPNADSLFNVPYEVGLCKNLQGMRIGDEHKNFCFNKGGFPADPDGLVIGYNDSLSNGFGGFEKYVFPDYFGRCSGEFNARDSMGPFAFSKISNAIRSGEQIGYDCNLMQTKVQGSGYIDPGVQFQMQNVMNDSHFRPGFSDRLYSTPQYGGFGNEDLSSSLLADPSLVCHSLYETGRMQQKDGLFQYDKAYFHPSISSVSNAGELNALSCEQSFTLDAICSNCTVGKKCKPSRSSKKKSRDEIMMKRSHEKELVLDSHLQFGSQEPFYYHSMLGNTKGHLQLNGSLTDLKGYIYLIAKHQLGCRFLQRIFDEGSPEDVKEIFKEVIDHVVELMSDPFGNYLIQKMLESCSEEQRLQIVLRVTKRRGDLVNICLSTHGTRVVQKLIESIKSNQQISLVMIALKPGLVDLIKDPNGNHVVQRCLQWLNNEQNKFIFDAAAKFCIDIACDRHGCCVLNRCIAYSSGVHREKLVLSISGHGLRLAQDAFGNYVIQQIIELKIPCAIATLLPLFEGHYVHLSMQKFSSHVVEKCLRFVQESHSRIIKELLSVHHFDQLLQDRFANYVVQAALEVTKGSPHLHAVLVQAIRPYQSLRSNPYCKKIFTSDVWKQ